MIKLLKYMQKRERWMVLAAIALIIGQIYFELTMPDYMSELTVLIKTEGGEMTDILAVGAKMLGCTLASAVLTVGCGFWLQESHRDSALPFVKSCLHTL